MKKENIYCKVVLVGNAGVGKTSIINRYVNDKFYVNSESTITSSYSCKKIEYPNYKKTLSLDIWDTAGQEVYRSLAKNFYVNASIGILVYDITNLDSFQDLKNYWYNELKNYGEKNMVFAVVGNKSDLYVRQQVNDEQVKQFAKTINAFCTSVSCQESLGINELFEKSGIKYLEQNQIIKKAKTFFIDKNSKDEILEAEKKGCCK